MDLDKSRINEITPHRPVQIGDKVLIVGDHLEAERTGIIKGSFKNILGEFMWDVKLDNEPRKVGVRPTNVTSPLNLTTEG